MPSTQQPEKNKDPETSTAEKEKVPLETAGTINADDTKEAGGGVCQESALGSGAGSEDSGEDFPEAQCVCDQQEENFGTESGSCEEQSGDSPDITSSREYQALNDKYLRLYAEFDNYRKRTARETIELMQTANAGLLEKLVPTLENFHAAFSPEKKATRLEDFEEGIRMIFNAFKDVLEDSGLEEINPEGEEFDPNFHDAMLQQNHDTVEDGHVIQVYQKGYKVKSKIIKHAKVIISKGKE